MVYRRTEGAIPAARAVSLSRESVGRQASLWPWVDAPPMPVLYVAGERDPAYARVAERLRGATGVSSVVVPAVGHALLTEAADKVAQLCVQFSTELRVSSPISKAKEQLSSLVRHSDGDIGTIRIDAAHVVPFSLALTAPLPLSRGAALEARDGLLIVVSAGEGIDGVATLAGVGELCPLPGFHDESYDDAARQLRRVSAAMRGQEVPPCLARLDGTMGRWIASMLGGAAEAAEEVGGTAAEASSPETAPVSLFPSVRCAVEMALVHLLARRLRSSIAQLLALATPTGLASRHSHVRINGLLARDEANGLEDAADQQKPLSGDRGGDRGGGGGDGSGAIGSVSRMRTWKVKVGGGDPQVEGRRVARLLHGCATLGLTLRLDANMAWDESSARSFCDALSSGLDAGLPPRSLPPSPNPRARDLHPALEFCEEPLQGLDKQLCRGALEATALRLHALHASHGLRHAIDECVVPIAQKLRDGALDATDLVADGTKAVPELFADIEHLQYERTPRRWTTDSYDAAQDMFCARDELRARLSLESCAALVLKPTLIGGVEVRGHTSPQPKPNHQAICQRP